MFHDAVSRAIGVDAVILDMDGLMLDTEPLYKRAWQTAAAELGYRLGDDFYLTLIGRTNAAGERALAERFGSGFPLARFQRRWPELWREDLERSGIPLKPGLPELLDCLADERIPWRWPPPTPCR